MTALERPSAEAVLGMTVGELLDATEAGSPRQLFSFARGARAAAQLLDQPSGPDNRTRPMAAAMLREAANRAERMAHKKQAEAAKRAADREAGRNRPRLAIDNTEASAAPEVLP